MHSLRFGGEFLVPSPPNETALTTKTLAPTPQIFPVEEKRVLVGPPGLRFEMNLHRVVFSSRHANHERSYSRDRFAGNSRGPVLPSAFPCYRQRGTDPKHGMCLLFSSSFAFVFRKKLMRFPKAEWSFPSPHIDHVGLVFHLFNSRNDKLMVRLRLITHATARLVFVSVVNRRPPVQFSADSICLELN